jgi:DNA-binding MarR family transcriptional regulator
MDSSIRKHLEPRSLDSAGNALAELNKVDHRTAVQLASNYSISELANWATGAELVQLGKTFSEMAKIDPKLARDALRKFGHAALLSKFRSCSDMKTFTKALSEVHSFDREMARDILDGFDDDSLSVRVKATNVEGLGRSLREIAVVSRSTASRVAAKLDLQSVLADLKQESLVQIGHSLTEINKADPLIALKLYAELPILMLARMAKESRVEFQQVCTIVSQLAAVERVHGWGRRPGRRTRMLIKEIGTDYFARSAQSVRFAELCAGLYDLFNCDENFGRDVLNVLRFQVLEAKARREQFEKLCPALHKLHLIDKSTASTLFDRLKGEELIGRASNLRLDKLAECLLNLADIDSEYAREIARRLGTDVLRIRFNQLAPKTRAQTLGKLRRVLPELHEEKWGRVYR